MTKKKERKKFNFGVGKFNFDVAKKKTPGKGKSQTHQAEVVPMKERVIFPLGKVGILGILGSHRDQVVLGEAAGLDVVLEQLL